MERKSLTLHTNKKRTKHHASNEEKKSPSKRLTSQNDLLLNLKSEPEKKGNIILQKPIEKNSSHSIFQSPPAKIQKIQNFEESPQNVLVCLLLRIFLFSTLFWLISLALIFLQIKINDYCFEPAFCQCSNIFVYIYTMAREFLCAYVFLIQFTYYGVSFMTSSFYQKFYFRNIYVTNCLIALFFFYGYDYERRFEYYLFIAIRRNLICFLCINGVFILLVTYASQSFNKEFFKKLGVTSLFQSFFIFHVFYMKPYFELYFVDFLQEHNSSLNSEHFKLMLLAYNLLYWYISVFFFSYFFQKIINESVLSLNIVIFMMKFVIVDVWEVMILNALTSPLDDFYGWIHITLYFYSILANYSRNNVILRIIYRLFFFLFKRKNQNLSNKWKNFNIVVTSCVLQGNLIIIFRIATYRVLGYFILFTKTTQNFLDCALKEQKGDFLILDKNLLIISVTHLLISVVPYFGFSNESLKK